MAADRPDDEVEDQETPDPADEIEEIDEVDAGPEGDEPDADAETDEPDGEADGDEAEDDADDPPPQKPSRGANLRERAKRAEREARELRERFERLESTVAQRPDPNAAAEAARREAEEDERIVLSGDSGAIARHFAGKSEKRVTGQLNQVVGHVLDQADRTEFRAMCAENPALKAVADEVEKQLVKSRAQGLNPKREALAKYILGERLLERAKGAKTRQEKRAGTERQRQQARPGSGRSDVNSSGRRRGDSKEARAKRLDESGLL